MTVGRDSGGGLAVCGCGLWVCGGGLVVGGGNVCGDWGCVSTGDGFQRRFAVPTVPPPIQ